MEDKVYTKTLYKVNGKEYHSFDELPEDAKKLFEDKDGNAIPDVFETNGTVLPEKRFFVEKEIISSIDDLPADLRKKLDSLPEFNTYKYSPERSNTRSVLITIVIIILTAVFLFNR